LPFSAASVSWTARYERHSCSDPLCLVLHSWYSLDKRRLEIFQMVNIHPTCPFIHKYLLELNGQGKSECSKICVDPPRKFAALEPHILPDIGQTTVNRRAGQFAHELILSVLPLQWQRLGADVNRRAIFCIVVRLGIAAVVVGMQVQEQKKAVLADHIDQQLADGKIKLVVLHQ